MIKCLLVSSSKTVAGFEYALTLPNGGLSSIAGNIDPDVCEVKVLDLVTVRFNAESYFKKYISKNHFDVIGFSCMVFQFYEILELAKIVRRLNKKALIILGGYYATVNYKEILQSDSMRYFDIIVRGEGENVFRQLIESVDRKLPYESIQGISFLQNGVPVHNECGELIDLNTLKIPDRNSRVLKNKFRIMDYKADVVETTRGCTFTCKYCTITKMYGRSYRKFTIERILKDITDAEKHGAKSILFTDDNIVLNRKHFEELCNGIINAGLNKIKYVTQASVQGFVQNPHLPELMRKAGFEAVFLGIENDSDEALQFFSKDNQLKSGDTEGVVRALHQQGIFVIGGLILGNPSDDKESLTKTYEFSKKIALDMVIFFALTPYPGTELREELLKGNYITNLNDYSKYDCYHMNVRTDHLSSFELFEIYDSFIQKYYLDSGAIFKVIKNYPLFFFKSFFVFLYRHPDMVFHHLTKGRWLKNQRRKKYLLQTPVTE